MHGVQLPCAAQTAAVLATATTACWNGVFIPFHYFVFIFLNTNISHPTSCLNATPLPVWLGNHQRNRHHRGVCSHIHPPPSSHVSVSQPVKQRSRLFQIEVKKL